MIYDELNKNIGFVIGDSLESQERLRFIEFLDSLEKMRQGNYDEYQIILDDPLGNSYIAGVGEGDIQILSEEYVRTEEQNEDLGISMMKTEGYSENP